MLNKKCLFGGGGLWLGDVIVIAIVTSSVVATESGRNKLNQIYWRIKANNSINHPHLEKKYAWIKNEFYDESIKKVIGKAIGDCVTSEGVFAGKKAGDLIVFQGTDPLGYHPEHWNAVMLYNYVFSLLSGKDDIYGENRQKTLESLSIALTKHYSDQISKGQNKLVDAQLTNAKNKIKQGLMKACSDISVYAEALNMEQVLFAIQNASTELGQYKKEQYWAPNLAAQMGDKTKFDFSMELNRIYRSNNGILEKKENKKLWNYSPTFKLIDNNWYIVSMMLGTGESTNDNYEWKISNNSHTNDAGKIKQHCQHVLKLLDGLAKLPEK